MRVVGLRAASVSFAALVTFLTSCDRDDGKIKVYRVSKAPLESSAAEQGTMPTNAASPAFPAGVPPIGAKTVSTPSNWEPQPLSQMRQASFLVKGDNGAVADVSLVSLGASAGNVLENVNRWLSQLGQSPITAEKLTEIAQRLTTSIGDVVIVDLAGLPKDADATKDGRIIAAVASINNSTLFFKMRGNAALTEAQKGDFIKWVAAVCNAQSENKSAPMTAIPPQDSGAPHINWKTPEGWTEVPPSSMRYASFNASGANGAKIDVSIVTFSGDGGSDADNVNRWRQQIGLPAASAATLKSTIVPLKNGGTDFFTVDMTGGDSRVIAAWTRRDGRSWFFKMSGPGPLVEREKPKFFDFLRSLQFHS